ncbi:Hypothetical protein DEACI_1031 [Acididesulfobacillus acetoxydans]|uniref:Uncharacterized protein n=1 Tax=Acididesulfobacillus acetoxydans TaxID=1561005 RepID=A0A8S0W249_9FIRM|nr:Hypothetical protein DEACI_1031 [Acididesulfobacillus acetoxydans]CEJ07900.1 Hypothetical protein DEACI_2370 [Acididesulfobacillus acetoxydans]
MFKAGRKESLSRDGEKFKLGREESLSRGEKRV